ncbi:hypothetical protein QCA50_004212 [Cerrena zonata]|uniref:Hydrophobin n=1 Tax=Cerrena zonata TaxID=2478898 RepID=A0AAW0GKW8_9APHY
MQFKLASVVAAIFMAGSALAAAVEVQTRQLGAGSLFGQPCGSLDLTILGFKAPLGIPCLDGQACSNTFNQSLPIPAPLSDLVGLEVDLGICP